MANDDTKKRDSSPDDVDDEWDDDEQDSGGQRDSDTDEDDWEDAEGEEEDDEDDDAPIGSSVPPKDGQDDGEGDDGNEDVPEQDDDGEGEGEDDEDDEEDEGDEEDDTSDDLIPDWAPWAVLIGLGLFGVLGGFGFLTPRVESGRTAADVAPSATPATTTTASPRPTATAKREAEETVEASHLLVAYKGANRARPTVTRTKEEAKKLAEKAAKEASAVGADFGALVAKYSDEPGAAQRKGALGAFSRRRMVKEFSDAAFKLKVGEVSGVVETGFGFHVIKRTK